MITPIPSCCFILPNGLYCWKPWRKRFEMGQPPITTCYGPSTGKTFRGERPHSECFILHRQPGRYAALVVRNREMSTQEKFSCLNSTGDMTEVWQLFGTTYDGGSDEHIYGEFPSGQK